MTTQIHDHSLRSAIISTAQDLNNRGFCPSKSGNVSVRLENGFLITPSGVQYDDLTPDDIVQIDHEGTVAPSTRRGLRPSSEWRFHQAIYQNHTEAQAIVHTHSPLATALSCARKPIPAFHYMIALAGGPDIRCADYATFGTEELAQAMLKALAGRKAVLLANHGVVAFGKSLLGAASLAIEVENLARQYLTLLSAGLTPVILDDAEMARVQTSFAGYGKA
jgi:L-fuculose-phosphate aldolase